MANERALADQNRTTQWVQSVVYFIAPLRSRRVKIGVTTDLPKRLKALQAANHVALKVLHAIPGDQGLEGQLHVRFRKYRQNNEWFAMSDEIKAFIFSTGGPFLPPSGSYTVGNEADEDELRAMLAATEAAPIQEQQP